MEGERNDMTRTGEQHDSMATPALAQLRSFFSFFFFQNMGKVEETRARSSQTKALNGHLNFARIINIRSCLSKLVCPGGTSSPGNQERDRAKQGCKSSQKQAKFSEKWAKVLPRLWSN